MLAIGCDHGGYALKEEVKKHLDERGIEYIDCGCNGDVYKRQGDAEQPEYFVGVLDVLVDRANHFFQSRAPLY